MTALWTEACLTFPALDAMTEGYEVYVVADAADGTSVTAHEMALRRVEQARGREAHAAHGTAYEAHRADEGARHRLPRKISVLREVTTMDAKPSVTVETLQALLAAFNRHDLDGIMAFFSDDPLLEMPRGSSPWGARARGREEVRRLLATRFAGIPDVHYGQDRHFACGDRGVSEWTLTGTSSGKKIEVRGCDLFEFSSGKISRKDSYWKIIE